ncbi:MAG: hypothetical protein V6Z78_02505 [Holosporaceae bacterium]
MLKKALFFSFCLTLCAQSTVLLASGMNMDDVCDAEKKTPVASARVTTLPAFVLHNQEDASKPANLTNPRPKKRVTFWTTKNKYRYVARCVKRHPAVREFWRDPIVRSVWRSSVVRRLRRTWIRSEKSVRRFIKRSPQYMHDAVFPSPQSVAYSQRIEAVAKATR